MNAENNDQQLRQRFSELKADDARRAPSFNAILRGRPAAEVSLARSPFARSFPWVRLAVGTSAMVLVIAGAIVTMARTHAHRAEKEMQRWAALSNWQAPSDTLLDLPSSAWGSAVTTPSDALMNDTTNTPDLNLKNL